VKKQNIKTQMDFRKWSKEKKRSKYIPANPHRIYKDKGWESWPDFLGTSSKKGLPSREYMSFDKAKQFIRSQNIETSHNFSIWSREGKRPLSIPSAPHHFYKDKGWISWPDFLRGDDSK